MRATHDQQPHYDASADVVPEGFADRQLALCDITQPELVHHGITVVKREGTTV